METQDRDVTDVVAFTAPQDGVLPVLRCVCGAEFAVWLFAITSREAAQRCPRCGRRLYFTEAIKVYEIVDADNTEAPSE